MRFKKFPVLARKLPDHDDIGIAENHNLVKHQPNISGDPGRGM